MWHHCCCYTLKFVLNTKIEFKSRPVVELFILGTAVAICSCITAKTSFKCGVEKENKISSDNWPYLLHWGSILSSASVQSEDSVLFLVMQQELIKICNCGKAQVLVVFLRRERTISLLGEQQLYLVPEAIINITQCIDSHPVTAREQHCVIHTSKVVLMVGVKLIFTNLHNIKIHTVSNTENTNILPWPNSRYQGRVEICSTLQALTQATCSCLALE